MPNTHETLTSLFTDIANSIRAKTGAAGQIVADSFPEVIASIPTSTSKAKQANLALESVAGTTYTKTLSMTVEKTGTYNVSWVGIRSTTTAGTYGTRLYIDDVAYGTARTTFNPQFIYIQQIYLTNVALTAGQIIEVRARGKASDNYVAVANFVIEEV